MINWPPNYGGIFDLDKKKKRLEELAVAAENPKVWEKPAEMQKLNKEKAFLEKALGEWNDFDSKLQDSKVLLEMAIEADDEGSFKEVKTELTQTEELGKALEIKRVLSGELDQNSSYISINSGAGGTEACDWAEMLYRMYMRYAEKHGYKVSE